VSAHRPYRRILVWFRRALRVDDNPALWNALHDGDEVVPLLCLSNASLYQKLTERRKFLRSAIRGLDADLRDRGTALHVRMGNPAVAIPAAVAAYQADAVYAVALHDAPGMHRDARLKQELAGMGAALILWPDRVMREANQVLNAAGSPYKVFTPYKRAWLHGADDVPRPVSLPRQIRSAAIADGSQLLAALSWASRGPGDEAVGAQRLLRAFLKNSAAHYSVRRDIPGVEGTSRLSPHLSVGTISIRRVYWAAREAAEHAAPSAREGISTFISELIWREFYYQVLLHFPHVLETAFREEFRKLRWSENARHFAQWSEGMTGYPIVDAAMRQLLQEGWMHNRARMIVASFLTKDLHISWQRGEQHFFRHLADADLASNNGGWQWAAGTGTDASPWFRIFNPVLQAKKFDPDGTYVRRYVPELRALPASHIHEPWSMNRQEQEAHRCVVGKHYPRPLVDHHEQRAKTMMIYKQSL